MYQAGYVRFVLKTQSLPQPAPLNVNVRKVSSAPLQTLLHLPALVTVPLTVTLLKQSTFIFIRTSLDHQANCVIYFLPKLLQVPLVT